ncbi:MAG: hypothetical protein ACI857_000533 [Arenicella sp.]|jgi:hypothetical protein
MRIFLLLPIFILSCADSESASPEESSEDSDNSSGIIMDEERLTAVDFNNELTYMQDGMLDQVDILFASDSSNVDLNLENAIFEAESSLQKLDATEKFVNSEDFVNAMLDLFNFYKDELSNNFGSIAEVIKKRDLTKVDELLLETYDLEFSQKEAAAFDVVFEAQNAFATENKIRLTDQ